MDYMPITDNGFIGEILIGDREYPCPRTLSCYKMPYISDNNIVALYAEFGITYPNKYDFYPRQERIEALLKILANHGQIDDFLTYMFSKARLRDYVISIEEPWQDMNDAYLALVGGAINAINDKLNFEDYSISMDNNFNVRYEPLDGSRAILDIDRTIKETPTLKESYNRMLNQLENGDYRSCITTARTLVEQSMINKIIERNSTYKPNGNLNSLFKDFKRYYRLNEDKSANSSLTKLLSGLTTVVQSIGELRNGYGNAHGTTATSLTRINKEDCVLIVNSAIAISIFISNIKPSLQHEL